MFDFLKQFLQAPIQTGAILPSSENFAEKIVESSNLGDADSIVELGSGTGVFTRKILENLSPGAMFFALETNKRFFLQGKASCPGAIIYNDNALNLQFYLKKHNLDGCDRIISGLPWAGFDKLTQRDLLNVIHSSLSPGGEFITFAYVHAKPLPGATRFNGLVKSKFATVNRSKIFWKNVPPAFLYNCVKQKI